MIYKRGDVALVLFPNADLRTAKRRPVLIVQADNLGTGLGQTITAMITSNLTRVGHPSRVFVSLATREGQQTRLLADSVIMTDNLVTLLEVEIDRKIGIWSNMAAVDAAIKHTLGIPPTERTLAQSKNNL
ncbi:type II toxin-antitoxin system PemK/MazF family toxin [Tychonema sp. LEGE 07199]|uniref:type II toxin-antitoxin system PemK/MazF family toxin n=1 Tax=unclassified Tychonema TaxID=2642144 RepID=UPI0018814374|nr:MULTISPECIES: type II toxin-antitoxin system PemK/MazF family toxin [unclassified Tychonema]MBE9122968.1 type II toxin-antitoxin system PemK/MazF family toxin [Tychonema sp. LEGE 07199]MBE9135580.1 type II toxin-antitoxin system PemK/MazF family toxin [Tychonema sp. LEGE 07196]